ncbi:MAG: hypothetical protein ACRDTC_15375 [Pseudonocardiaceae bacterium]
MTDLALNERVRVVAVTDAHTHQAHLMTDDAAMAGRHTGCYRTVCGELVSVASLTTPERDHCRRCEQWRAAR